MRYAPVAVMSRKVRGESESAVEVEEADGKPASGQIRFHYIKSGYFRTVLADGAWGGVSPAGRINIVFYNERAPIPRIVTHSVKESRLGEELERESRDGIVREVEVAVALDLPAAESLLTWLEEKVQILRELKKRSP